MAPRCSWTGRRGREVNRRKGGRFFFSIQANLAHYLGVFACLLNFTRKARRRGFFFSFDVWCGSFFKVLLLIKFKFIKFRPLLLTTCDSTAITDHPKEQRMSCETCVHHVKCTVYAAHTVSTYAFYIIHSVECAMLRCCQSRSDSHPEGGFWRSS